MITPFDDFVYLVNNVLLGDKPAVEDYILLIGTITAFVAFILWCCFPVSPKEVENKHQHYDEDDIQLQYNQRKIDSCSS